MRNCLNNSRGFDFYVAPFAAAGFYQIDTLFVMCVLYTNEF